MNRGFLTLSALLLSTTQTHAHVSHTQGAAHASEHLWLLLALVPLAFLVRPLVRRLARNRKH